MMKVLAGDWKVSEYAAFKKSFLGKKLALLMPLGMVKKEEIPFGSIVTADIVTDVDSLSRRAGWAAIGALALGPIGLLAGAIAGKKSVVAVEFKDGRKALLECGGDDVVTLKSACFGAGEDSNIK